MLRRARRCSRSVVRSLCSCGYSRFLRKRAITQIMAGGGCPATFPSRALRRARSSAPRCIDTDRHRIPGCRSGCKYGKAILGLLEVGAPRLNIDLKVCGQLKARPRYFLVCGAHVKILFCRLRRRLTWDYWNQTSFQKLLASVFRGKPSRALSKYPRVS